MKLPFLPNHDDPSFFDFLTQHHPALTPTGRSGFLQAQATTEPMRGAGAMTVPQATTVLAIKYQQGVVIAGDRRATEGFQIAERRIEKVFKIDEYSAMAIAGAAGPCIEMAKLFQVELEHYEKLEGVQLSCEGKANKLGQMVKANLPMVFQGLVVMPLYVGYDLKRAEGRIFKYDLAGGRYEESDYHAIGSGGKDARNTMREHSSKAWLNRMR
jgi:proteasome beta subunit